MYLLPKIFDRGALLRKSGGDSDRVPSRIHVLVTYAQARLISLPDLRSKSGGPGYL